MNNKQKENKLQDPLGQKKKGKVTSPNLHKKKKDRGRGRDEEDNLQTG